MYRPESNRSNESLIEYIRIFLDADMSLGPVWDKPCAHHSSEFDKLHAILVSA